MPVDDDSRVIRTPARQWFDTLVWMHDYDGLKQLAAPKGVPADVEMRLYDKDGVLKNSHATPGEDYFPALVGSFSSWFIPEGEVLVLGYQGEEFRVVGSEM